MGTIETNEDGTTSWSNTSVEKFVIAVFLDGLLVRPCGPESCEAAICLCVWTIHNLQFGQPKLNNLKLIQFNISKSAKKSTLETNVAWFKTYEDYIISQCSNLQSFKKFENLIRRNLNSIKKNQESTRKLELRLEFWEKKSATTEIIDY